MASSAAPTRWVLLRGLARESAHWDDFPRRFAAAVPGAQCFPVDFPGTGVHWRKASPSTVAGLMAAVRTEALRRSAKFGQAPLFLLSISLGSMVAIEWARHYPDELAGIVLINTSLGGLNPWYDRLNWRVLPAMLRIARERDVARRETAILKLTSSAPAVRADLVEARVDAYRQRPIGGRTVLRQLWAAACFRPRPDKPRIPVLLLSGLGDRMVAPRCTADLGRIWAVEPRRHPTAGHDLPLDDPDWTVRSVREWLDDVRR